jgi:hypothetical protein
VEYIDGTNKDGMPGVIRRDPIHHHGNHIFPAGTKKAVILRYAHLPGALSDKVGDSYSCCSHSVIIIIVSGGGKKVPKREENVSIFSSLRYSLALLCSSLGFRHAQVHCVHSYSGKGS